MQKLSFKAFANFLDESIAVLEALHWKKIELEKEFPEIHEDEN